LKTKEMAIQAKRASRRLATASAAVKNRALIAMADALERRSAEILVENADDIAARRGFRERSLTGCCSTRPA
jgi:glutamate-5-semialdehyde dehydrogenase